MIPKRKINWYSVAAIAFAGAGLGVGVIAMLQADPFMGLFSISLVSTGGVAALLGLQEPR